jgi:hypothetical protein
MDVLRVQQSLVHPILHVAHLTAMREIPAMEHRTAAELEAGLDAIRGAPRDAGVVELIARRPAVGEREVLDEAQLDTATGLVGDSWITRPSSKTPDNSPHPEMQVTLMNARVIRLLRPDGDWAIAGDQFFVDLDLSLENVPAGTRLALGSAIVEVTAPPHRGCAKFSARFGSDVLRWANSPTGRALNLRGVHARVIQSGTIRRGDPIRKIA